MPYYYLKSEIQLHISLQKWIRIVFVPFHMINHERYKWKLEENLTQNHIIDIKRDP